MHKSKEDDKDDRVDVEDDAHTDDSQRTETHEAEPF